MYLLFGYFRSNYFAAYVRMLCKDEQISQGRSYSNEKIEVSDCFFCRSLVYSQNGGVIYVNGGSLSMIVISSMFHNCKTNPGSGGAIFFSSLNIKLCDICAHQCSSTNYHFGYFASINNNELESISINYCSQTKTGAYCITVQSGNQRSMRNNCSGNSALNYCGIAYKSPVDLYSSFCTLYNNYAENQICLLLSPCHGSILFTNIIKNTCPSGNGVVFSSDGLVKMDYCIFDLNQNLLFTVSSGSLVLSHCFISHSGIVSKNTALDLTNNNSMTKHPTYVHKHFNSYYCIAFIPNEEPTIQKIHSYTFVVITRVPLILEIMIALLLLE